MMTDTNLQQSTDTNGQTLVTQSERQALIQKLNARWTMDLSKRVENLAYEKSQGIKPTYFKMVHTYYTQVQNAQQNHANQQQQTLQSLNNNGQFINQQINMPQQTSNPIINHSQQPSNQIINHSQHQLNHLINQQSRFPSVQPTLQPRMTNPQPNIIPNQGVVRSREPQKFNQTSVNPRLYTPSLLNPNPSTIQTTDLSQNYASQQQINNQNLNDYLTQPSMLPNRYLNQPAASVNARPRTTTNLNANFAQQSSSNNSNDVLHQVVTGNPTTNTSSNGDRLLQQILLSNNDGSSNKTPLQNRQSTSTIMSQPIRSSSTTNSNLNTLRPSIPSQQPSPSSSVIIMPTQTSNVQIQPSPNVSIQQSPLNNTNAQVVIQPSSITMNNSSTPLLNNNYTSPINRSLPSIGSGNISSPDEETINLIKFLKENITKLQSLCQKFTNDGHLDKARNAQAIHQQMVQFITNPTYESLPNAKHIRDMLERATNRSQPSNSLTTNIPTAPTSVPQINELNQFEKILNEYLSRDKKKRLILNKYFVEPLSDVINGVPHKKIRLDVDNNSNRITNQNCYPSSFLSNLNDELNLLPTNRFSVEQLPVSHVRQYIQLNDDLISKGGIVLKCKLLEFSNPLIPTLRLRISTRYPDDQPEILSLTDTMPPKLEFTDGHPFFEQLSTIFVSYLFKLPSQHTVTDILNIWYQSVQSAL